MDVTELMEATKSGMNIIDIGVTVRKHKVIMKLLQAVKAFSGCNTVCHYQGTGKKPFIKILEKQPLINLVDH